MASYSGPAHRVFAACRYPLAGGRHASIAIFLDCYQENCNRSVSGCCWPDYGRSVEWVLSTQSGNPSSYKAMGWTPPSS
jgi:hypothetical protein